MKRIGFYSGKIYTDEDFNNHKIEECCHLITEKQAKDKEFRKILIRRFECRICRGCPLVQKELEKENNL